MPEPRPQRRARLLALTGAVAAAVTAGIVAALANFVPVWLAVLLGAAGGALGVVGALRWERHVARRAVEQAWQAVVDAGPARDATADENSLLAALNPDQEVVAFNLLREPDLRAFLHWCRDEDGTRRVWRVIGGAGIGKTRFLLEAADRLHGEGWVCGWVRRGHGAAAVEAAAAQRRPVLLIVDDAETRADLADLVTTLARTPVTSRVRAVLAGREFGGWWAQLRAQLDPEVHASLPPPGQTQLAALASTVTEVQQLFTQAVGYYARHFALPVPTVTVTGVTPAASLAEVHAAAAAAAWRSLSGSLSLDAALRLLFTTEEAWWQRSAAAKGLTCPPPVLRAAVATAALVGAEDLAQAVRRLCCLPGLISAPDHRVEEVALWLRQLYPQRTGDWLDPHLPARLAERYAATALTSDPTLPPAVTTAALTA